jgi:hypothetical protein
VKAFLLPPRTPRKSPKSIISGSSAIHTVSTKGRQLSAPVGGCPPVYSQPVHKLSDVAQGIPAPAVATCNQLILPSLFSGNHPYGCAGISRSGTFCTHGTTIPIPGDAPRIPLACRLRPGRRRPGWGATACSWSVSASAASPTRTPGGTRRLGLALTFDVIAAADHLRSQGAEGILSATETRSGRIPGISGCSEASTRIAPGQRGATTRVLRDIADTSRTLAGPTPLG